MNLRCECGGELEITGATELGAAVHEKMRCQFCGSTGKAVWVTNGVSPHQMRGCVVRE